MRGFDAQENDLLYNLTQRFDVITILSNKRSHGVLASPLASRRLVSLTVVLILLSYLRHQRVVWIWIRQQRADRQKNYEVTRVYIKKNSSNCNLIVPNAVQEMSKKDCLKRKFLKRTKSTLLLKKNS